METSNIIFVFWNIWFQFLFQYDIYLSILSNVRRGIDPLQLRIVFFYISHMFHNRKHTEYFFIFGEFNDFSIEQYKFL